MSMPSNRKLLILALCLLAGTAGGVTLAAFSGQTSNSGNTFSAATTFPGQLRMASGPYTGNGNDNRAIAGLGFQPDVVIVKRDGGSEAYMKTATMAGDASQRLVGGSSLESNRIQALGSNGFELGSDDRVNKDGDTYYWTAFKAAGGVLKLGTYTGNGTSQTITGVGFSPEFLIVADSGGERAIQHYAGDSNSYRFDADAGSTSRVTSLNNDGFSVGSANEANRSGRTYHYVAFNEVAGSVKVASYNGTGSAGLSVSGVGFAPEYVIVRGAANVTGQHRSATVPGNQSLYFQNNGNLTTGITALQSDGFQLGNHSSVNNSATTYRYVAFNNAAGGCARPSENNLFLAANDSWVDQASPGANNGGDTLLNARSQSGGQNQRVFIDFDLPAMPSGCTVTGATFAMYDAFPTGGRTLEARRVTSNWSENGVTWANQPTTTAPAATTTAPASAGWTAWDATAIVSAQYSSGNFGFRVSDQTEGAASAATQRFGARESGSAPPVLLLSIGG